MMANASSVFAYAKAGLSKYDNPFRYTTKGATLTIFVLGYARFFFCRDYSLFYDNCSAISGFLVLIYAYLCII